MRLDELPPNGSTRPWTDEHLSRRDALRAAAAIAIAVVGCRPAPEPDRERPAPGRLTSRPSIPTQSIATGLGRLGLAGRRDGLLYVPPRAAASAKLPLVLMLHGAGQSAEIGIRPFLPLAEAAGLVLVAPDSRNTTWDFVNGPYGADVAFIDRALAYVFERCAVDPERITIEGFSDGASYALSLGVTNGDLFSRIVAFSPCVFAPAGNVGHPRIFISHGTEDHILPIVGCGRRLAARLGDAGYAVTYREFSGPHTVPADIAREAVDWLS